MSYFRLFRTSSYFFIISMFVPTRTFNKQSVNQNIQSTIQSLRLRRNISLMSQVRNLKRVFQIDFWALAVNTFEFGTPVWAKLHREAILSLSVLGEHYKYYAVHTIKQKIILNVRVRPLVLRKTLDSRFCRSLGIFSTSPLNKCIFPVIWL